MSSVLGSEIDLRLSLGAGSVQVPLDSIETFICLLSDPSTMAAENCPVDKRQHVLPTSAASPLFSGAVPESGATVPGAGVVGAGVVVGGGSAAWSSISTHPPQSRWSKIDAVQNLLSPARLFCLGSVHLISYPSLSSLPWGAGTGYCGGGEGEWSRDIVMRCDAI